MKIATWNVNSLRVRLPQVLQWTSEDAPDILALQETKIQDSEFPRDAFHAAGYQCIFAGQKAYNGVCILSRTTAHDVVRELPASEDPQRRLLAATYEDVRIVNVYVPNGESTSSEKFAYKLDWLARLTRFIGAEMHRYPRLIVLGDFNIAPEDEDVHDPAQWREQVLCSTPEREAFRGLIGLGLHDTFRRFKQTEGQFTWWDYRMAAFRRNRGLRIDHILASESLSQECISCHIDRTPRQWERPSDHAPVVAAFSEHP